MTLIRAQKVEATAGFEPANEGFADLSTTLGTRGTVVLRALSAPSGRLRIVDHSVDHDAQLRIQLARETVARQVWLARMAVVRRQLAEMRGMAA